MSVQVHPRFLRRRASVREHRARSHLRRALWVDSDRVHLRSLARVEAGMSKNIGFSQLL